MSQSYNVSAGYYFLDIIYSFEVKNNWNSGYQVLTCLSFYFWLLFVCRCSCYEFLSLLGSRGLSFTSWIFRYITSWIFRYISKNIREDLYYQPIRLFGNAQLLKTTWLTIHQLKLWISVYIKIQNDFSVLVIQTSICLFWWFTPRL